MEQLIDPVLDSPYVERKEPTAKCAQAAYSRGFHIFGLQDGGDSSAHANSTYHLYITSEDCREDGEGGKWANQVYQIQVLEEFNF